MRKLIISAVIVALLLQTLLIACVYAAGPPVFESKVFVHYARSGTAKPQPPTTERGYYTTFSKWKVTPVAFEINPSVAGIPPEVVVSEVLAGINEWDDGTYSLTDDWSGVARNLFIYEETIKTTTYSDTWWNNMDEHNTILWAPLSAADSKVIAVTKVWGNKPVGIVEFDMIFNTAGTDMEGNPWSWGVVTESNKGIMDIRNIATHELGHAVGMGDLYNTVAYRETMYGYSGVGETTKQDLYIGDQAGITKLYR